MAPSHIYPTYTHNESDLLQAGASEYLSKIAWEAGIDLAQFTWDNRNQVKDLDAALAGTKLLLCSPKGSGNLYI